MTAIKKSDQASALAAYAKSLETAKNLCDLNAFISIDENIDVSALPKGRLSGVTVALKDAMHATGMPNTAGTTTLENFIPNEDAAVVKRLNDERAIIVGKTNMRELAYGIQVTTRISAPSKIPTTPPAFPLR